MPARPAVSWSCPAPPPRMGEPALSVRLTLHRLRPYQRTGPGCASARRGSSVLGQPAPRSRPACRSSACSSRPNVKTSSPRAGKGPPGPVATQARGRSREYPVLPVGPGRLAAARETTANAGQLPACAAATTWMSPTSPMAWGVRARFEAYGRSWRGSRRPRHNGGGW